MHKGTFAARACRWSARHRKTAILGWLGFVVACVVAGQLVGMKSSSQDTRVGDSGRAETLFSDHFPKSADESVLVQAPRGGTVRDPEVRRAVADVVLGAVQGKARVAKVASPYAKGNATSSRKDGRSSLVTFELAATTPDAEGRSTPSWPPSTA